MAGEGFVMAGEGSEWRKTNRLIGDAAAKRYLGHTPLLAARLVYCGRPEYERRRSQKKRPAVGPSVKLEMRR